MTACRFPACSEPSVSRGWCAGHYQQWCRQRDTAILRGESPSAAEHMYRLKPLRGAHGSLPEAERRVKLPGIRVSPAAALALTSRGPTRTAAARGVIEEWAKGRQRK